MDWSKRDRESERLAGLYREMGDDELLGLSGTAGDLTEAAQEALTGEMKRRRLEVAIDDAGVMPGREDSGEDMGAGWRTLHVFQQTFEAQAAFRILERAEIGFVVEDRTLNEMGEPIPGPAVQLALMVEGADWDRCVVLLRREAGLFPVAVVDPRGAVEGAEEEMVAVGEFEEAEDVALAARALDEAGVWYRTVTHDGEDWERTSIEVREGDGERALEALSRLLEEDERRL